VDVEDVSELNVVSVVAGNEDDNIRNGRERGRNIFIVYVMEVVVGLYDDSIMDVLLYCCFVVFDGLLQLFINELINV
jgi:hypothetical protein